MIYTAEQPLPVRIPGTGYLVEAVSDGTYGWTFIQDRRKSFLQILCEDSQNPNSLPVLLPDQIHTLWDSLRAIYEEGEDSLDPFDHEERKQYMRHFFSPEAQIRGAEYGDMEPTLEQLHWEMRYQHLYMNSLVVFRNEDGLVENLNGARLPTAIQPVTVYIPSSDPMYGSLKQFQEAGGRIISHGNSPGEYLSYCGWNIEAVRWMLGNCEVDGPSNTYDQVSIDSSMSAGVLRGRKVSD